MRVKSFLASRVLMFATGLTVAGVCLGSFAAETARQTQTKTLRPPGEGAGPAVTITYEASTYEPAEAIPVSGTPNWDTRSPEATFRAVFLANKQANTNLIVKGFAPAERERIAGMVAQPDLLSKNTGLYARIASVVLLQKTFYGEYILLTTAQEDATGNQWRANYAFKLTGEGWLLTNDLTNDRVYSQLLEILAPKAPAKAK